MGDCPRSHDPKVSCDPPVEKCCTGDSLLSGLWCCGCLLTQLLAFNIHDNVKKSSV